MAPVHGSFLGMMAIVAPSLSAATLTVDVNGSADYADIQTAIDAAEDGDTVLVKPGEYVIAEPIDFNRLNQPDDPASPPLKNIVVQSEGGPEMTTIEAFPLEGQETPVVSFRSGEGPGSALDGFKVTGGTTSGVHCENSSPTVTNCVISSNAASSGGGVYCLNSSPTLTGCTISGNSASFVGGGIYCEGDSSPTLTGCTIAANSAPGGGGGVGYSGRGLASAKLTGCTITGNWARGAGGGVYSSSSATLTNCTISGNRVSADGSFFGGGGGVYCSGRGNAFAALTNCTISGNWAESVGGGLYCLDSSPTLTNCTISGNSAMRYCGPLGCEGGGGMACDESSSPTLANCIVWGNAPESVCGALSHCLTDQDPLFVQTGRWVDCGAPDDPLCIAYEWSPDTGEPTAWHSWVLDYHLRPGSPAIDAGTSEYAPTTDLEGHGRPCGEGVDIGAYESGDCPPSGTSFVRGDVDMNANLEITDAVRVLGHLFLGEDEPSCLDAADADDSGTLTITDAIYSLSFLFLGGPAPRSPFPDCGIEERIDGLDCAAYSGCP